MNFPSFPRTDGKKFEEGYYGLDVTVNDTGNIYLELELAPAPSVVW